MNNQELQRKYVHKFWSGYSGTKFIILLIGSIMCLTACSQKQTQSLTSNLTITPIIESKQVTGAYNPNDFIVPEILGRPTDTSITVNVVPKKNMEIYYEYGISANSYSAQTNPITIIGGIPSEVILTGLQPNTRYYFRLRYDGLAGIEHTFITQRAPGSTFTFEVIGDSHPERTKSQFNPLLYEKTLTSIFNDQPDFLFTIGDDFSVDTLKSVNQESVSQLYLNQRKWLGITETPIFLVNGNHEQASLANLDGTPNNVAVWAQNSRNVYFPQPAPGSFYSGDAESVAFIGQLRDYYAFTWGDALFVVIDQYWHSPAPVDNGFNQERDSKKDRDLWNNTLGEIQYQWFCDTLSKSSAKYKFVFAHHVNGTGRGGVEVADSYEWGDTQNLSKHRPGWEKTIHQVMVDAGVTIFFQGHDHLFARQELDGVVYITLPQPADDKYGFDNRDAYLSGDVFPSSGYVRVQVGEEGGKVEYVRTYLDQPDEVAFTFIVP